MEKINSWNHERLLELAGGDTVVFDTITTGNFGGFDVWLDEGAAARIELDCNRCTINETLADIGYEATTVDLGGLYRELRVIRLPDDNCHLSMTGEVDIPLAPTGDNPLWISAYTEDGFQAWSSPIFAYRSET